MAPVVEVQNEVVEEKEPVKETPSKLTIGIIYPPPEMRNIVDKTASFVARNGPEFEARIRQNEINNKKFNFLNSGDPYHAYYQHKVKEFKEGRAVVESAVVPPPTVKPAPSIPKPPEIAKITELPIIPKEPPPEFEFINDPPSISALDLDVVKFTAQFVARNGRQFLMNLMNREQRNYQFDFLRPQHSLFNYFKSLLEQYTKILIPPKDLINKLKQEADTPKLVLDQVKYRVEWTKHQEAIKRREEEEAERERVQYAQIDWHDFVVVETVDYQPNEQGLFPPPTTPEEVGTRVLAQQRFEEEGEEVEMEVESDDDGTDTEVTNNEKSVPDNIQIQDMEQDSSDDDSEKPPKSHSPPPQPPKEAPPQPPPLPPQPDQVIIRKDYNPKVTAKVQPTTTEQYLISPITGEKIPADKMQEHMRIGLLDPRWVEQRDRAVNEKIQQEEVYAQGSAIESSLKQFAERRTDIFGSGDEETAIGKKIGEEEKRRPEKVTWDGHTASMEAATRAARANITIEEQIQQIHKIKGLLPDEEKERIGPSKPSQQGDIISAATIASNATTSAPPLPATSASAVKPPPLPPASTLPATTVIQRTHAPPHHIAVAARPTGPIPGIIPPQPIMPPPQTLMMPPLAPAAPHIQPPPIIAMPQPPLGAGMGPAPPFGQPMAGIPAPPPPQHEPTGPSLLSTMAAGMAAEDEPLTKRQKTEENLVPEEEFLKENKSPVTFCVQLPTLAEKADWKLNGQIITLTLPLTDMVSVIKAKIHEETGMPPGKQKLIYEGMFIKDSNTLAYYNVLPSTTVIVQVKERGGRKK